MKWEYKILGVGGKESFEMLLIDMGKQGYKFISIHDGLVVFERPLKEEVPEEVLRDVLK